MCLEVSRVKTEKFERDNKGKVTCYKVLNYCETEDELVSPYQHTHYRPGTITGVKANKSDRYNDEVHYGIHVYGRRCDIPWWMMSPSHRLIVAVTCDMDDFIAAGFDDDLVFTKVELSEESY
jgi:hypothetical protein